MSIGYDVFVNDPPEQDGFLPNGEPRRFSPTASTLIRGSRDAVLVDPGMTLEQARVLGDWVAAKGVNLTDIFITHGHGDHWFAAGPLVERFGARVVAAPGTINQMRRNRAARPLLWDKVYSNLPLSPVTAVAVPDNRFTLEGHDLVIVEVGHTDSDDSTVLHVPDLGLVAAGDVVYNGAHQYIGDGLDFSSWRAAIDLVKSLGARHIVSGHQPKQVEDDDADRLIAATRQYLDDADEFLKTENTALDFFDAELAKYPDHVGRYVLWAGARTQYGVRGNPGADVTQLRLSGWL